jgi:TonB family protein
MYIMKKRTMLFTMLVIACNMNAQTVTIGSQGWMTKNLDVATFRNGDSIPEAKTDAEWISAGYNKQPAWCYYDNDTTNGILYGKLYNWYAVNDPRGLAPEGYHVPTDAEWTQLSDYLGGKEVAGNKMKRTMGWNENGNGTNESGFKGLPGGARNEDRTFILKGYDGFWWSASEETTGIAYFRRLDYSFGSLYRNGIYKSIGLSVRCILDDPVTDSVPTQDQLEDTKAGDKTQDGSDENFDPPLSDVTRAFETEETFESIFKEVEEEADYPGGRLELIKFISDNIEYPEKAIKKGINGRVTVRFVVEKDGKITNISVAIPLVGCEACDKATVKVVEKMPPWIPAKNKGFPVRSWVDMSVSFQTE